MRPRLPDLLDRVTAAMDLAVCSGCDECGLRCTDDVPMSRDEYADVVAYAETVDAARAAVSRAPTLLDIGEGWMVSVCRFRDAAVGRCRIYPVRPLVCRLMGHVEWMPCPVGRVPAPVPGGIARTWVEEYAELERRPFASWRACEGGDSNGSDAQA